jgi:uncharacterized glyoxalase superfamily protein PhnB
MIDLRYTEAAMSAATAALFYRDPRAALAFLAAGLGLEAFMVLEDQSGAIAHAELRLGAARIMVGGEWSADAKSPLSVEGKNTQIVHLTIDEAVDAHCERARAAGFTILMAPEDQFYGDRTYRARDPEGHVWAVGQAIRFVSREDAAAATGLTITGWPDEPSVG